MNSMLKTPVSPCTSEGMRAENILAEIRTNLLECKVCFEKFSVQQRDHRPRNLPCGHVLCLKCICTLSHPVHQRLECPFCRKQCDVGSTSESRTLTDLQELLLSGGPRVPVHHRVLGWAEGLGSGALRLSSVFGGWGKIINPTGMAMTEPSGQIVVVHDGEKRVAVFSSEGRYLHGFGSYGHGPAHLCHPLDVAIGPSGHIVVTDAGDRAVKVFSSKGCPVVTISDSFQLPWGADVDSRGRIFVTDAEMGTLSQIMMDFTRCTVLVNRVVLKKLNCPRSVASSRVSGNIAVVEHLGSQGHYQGGFTSSCLSIFTSDFIPLTQVDSFSLNLMNSVSLFISSVVFDRNGDVIVGDAQHGMVWALGKPQKTVQTPLVSGLLRPAGLAATAQNVLIVLDSGDHTVKLFTADTDDIYSDKK